MINMIELPFAENALEPYISRTTMSFHYGKHYKGYVDKINELILGTPLEKSSLLKIILKASQEKQLKILFNNAAQVFNHEFYWKSLTPKQQEIPSELKEKLIRDFGSIETFLGKLLKIALGHFGSGWIWLIENKHKLEIITTENAQTPILLEGVKPLLCIDVWEHAYYLDYQNKRADYLNNIISHNLNWDFALKNLKVIKVDTE